MAITALPDPPSRSDPANFPERADAFMAALPQFANEANTLQEQVDDAASAVENYKNIAQTSAGSSLNSQNAAAQSAFQSAGSATQSAQARADAEVARDLAQDWAAKPSGPVGGTTLLSAFQYAQQAAAGAGAGLPQYLANAIPTSDVGPIYVHGIGLMTWAGIAGTTARYTPAQFPRMYRKGGQITVGNTAVLVGPGEWRDRNDAGDICSYVGISKNLQTSGAWAPGSNANGLFSGVAQVATTYHFFIIKNSSTGQIDAGFDTLLNAGNRTPGYDLYRRVCTVRNSNVGVLNPMAHRGDNWFMLGQAGQLVIAGTVGTAFTTVGATTTLVPGVRTEVLLNLFTATVNSPTAITVQEPGVAGAPTSATNATASMTSVPNVPNSAQVQVFTDSSGQVQYAATGAITTGQFNMYLRGWRDFLED